jgi:hypothetical protein
MLWRVVLLPKQKGKYLIEIIMVDESQHKHIFKRTNDTFLKFKEKNQEGEEVDISIEPKDLYEIPSNIFFSFFSMLFRGIIQHFLVIVNKTGTPIKETAPAISGKVLKVARDWKGLDKAVNDSFGSRFEIPKLAMLGALVIFVIIIVFLIWKGFIPLPSSWK